MKFGFASAFVFSVLMLTGLGLLLTTGENSMLEQTGEPLVIYCAAGIRLPVEDVLEEYEKQYGVTFLTKFAGSGELKSDLRVGGGDLYLAADVTYLIETREKGLVREFVPIAHQYPVIAVRKGNPKHIRGLVDLQRDDVQLSLADPDRAAVSKVTRKLLKPSGQWEPIWKRVAVQRGTVNEVANDVAKLASGDAGIVWNATVGQYDDLEMISVPELEQSPNQITIGVLESSKQPTRALHFIRYLTSRDRGLKHFQKFGYKIVDGDKWVEKPEIVVFSGGLNFPAIEETIEEFENREGVTVLTTAGGCGTLVGQMKAGEHPDIYFSCDVSFMSDVKDLFLDAVNVSQTDMVIITQKGNEHRIQTIKDLAQQGLELALCDPQKSALGKLTEQLLRKHGLLNGVRANQAVTGPTAAETVMYVVNGKLDAAIVYEANTIHQAKRGNLEVIPIDDPDAIAIQPLAVGKKSDFPLLTARLMEQILSAESKKSFGEFGFKWLVE